MKLKTNIICLIASAAVIGILSGCGGSTSKEVTNKVTIWHWMTDRKETFNELAAQYTKLTGTEIEFKLFFPPETYAQKVTAAVHANDLPEIFAILGEKKKVASFIKAGHISDLTAYMQENNSQWQNQFYPQTLAVAQFEKGNIYKIKEGTYGVPFDTAIMQFVFNKSLLDQAGLDPNNYPKTIDEFISMAKTVQEKTDAVGFICGWGEGWLLNALATEWAINIMGEEKFLKTIQGEIPYTDQDWITVFALFKTLRDSGILSPNIATMTNKESEEAFSRGKAAFSFNGSWSVNVYKKRNPELDYGFFSLPKASSKFPVKVWGGAGATLRVNSHSANKEKAIAFLKWLTATEQQLILTRDTNNFPAVKGCEKALPNVLKPVATTFRNFTHPDTWPKNEDSRVIEILNRGLQQIVMGIKTPEEVAQEIQSKKERVSK